MRQVPIVTEGQHKDALTYTKHLAKELPYIFVRVEGVAGNYRNFKVIVGCALSDTAEVVEMVVKRALMVHREDNPPLKEHRYAVQIQKGAECAGQIQDTEQPDLSEV